MIPSWYDVMKNAKIDHFKIVIPRNIDVDHELIVMWDLESNFQEKQGEHLKASKIWPRLLEEQRKEANEVEILSLWWLKRH